MQKGSRQVLILDPTFLVQGPLHNLNLRIMRRFSVHLERFGWFSFISFHYLVFNVGRHSSTFLFKMAQSFPFPSFRYKFWTVVKKMPRFFAVITVWCLSTAFQFHFLTRTDHTPDHEKLLIINYVRAWKSEHIVIVFHWKLSRWN